MEFFYNELEVSFENYNLLHFYEHKDRNGGGGSEVVYSNSVTASYMTLGITKQTSTSFNLFAKFLL